MNHVKKKGFTLIELLIAMAITSIVMMVVVSAYMAQARAKNTQEALTDMNQTARAALEIMQEEIRMAGLNPLKTANSRIILANAGEIIFSLDRGNGASFSPDGDCCDNNEVIRYHLTLDRNNDGVNDNIADGVECHLGRETGGGIDPDLSCGGRNRLQPLGRNVDALNFVYLDQNGAAIPAVTLANQAGRDTIRSVQVMIVARAGTASNGFLYNYTDQNAYANLQGQPILPAQADHFRRLLLTTTISCRNLNR